MISNRTLAELQRRAGFLQAATPHLPGVFHHLFAILPDPGEAFPMESRTAFFAAMSSIWEIVYKDAPAPVAADALGSLAQEEARRMAVNGARLPELLAAEKEGR